MIYLKLRERKIIPKQILKTSYHLNFQTEIALRIYNSREFHIKTQNTTHLGKPKIINIGKNKFLKAYERNGPYLKDNLNLLYQSINTTSLHMWKDG